MAALYTCGQSIRIVFGDNDLLVPYYICVDDGEEPFGTTVVRGDRRFVFGCEHNIPYTMHHVNTPIWYFLPHIIVVIRYSATMAF